MLVEVGVFAGDVVGGRELEDTRLEGIVDEVAAAVGLVAVGVGIAGVPAEVDVVVGEEVLAVELCGVGGAALVVVLGGLLLVVLRRYAHAGGVSLAPELVEDILELDAVFAGAACVTEVEHQAEAGMDSLLVVSRLAEVLALLLGFVVGTEEAVEHIAVVLVGAAVVAAEEHGERLPGGERPTLAAVEAETEVADGGNLFDSPVVVEMVAGEGDAVFGTRVAFEDGVNAVAEAAQPAVEAEPVGGGGLGAEEGLPVGLVVHCTAEVDLPRAVFGYVLGLDEHHAAGVVGGVFGCGGLDNHEVIELRGGQEVERERAGIGLRTGDGGTVDPHLVVALGETAHHDELVVDEGDSRHAAYDLGGIAVLCALYLLAADTRLDAECGLGGLENAHLGVLAAFGYNSHLLQYLGVGTHKDFEGVLLRLGGEAGGLVAHIGDDEGVGGGGRESEESVEVGGGACGGTADEDGGSDEGLAGVGVKDETDAVLGGKGGGDKEE